MPDNNTVKIGGVTYNKDIVKSSGVVVKDGKKLNSVFLKDGTHIEYPTQSENNQSAVSQKNRTYVTPEYKRSLDVFAGEYRWKWTLEEHEDPSVKITSFNRINHAKITGTENSDRYYLNGCTNSEVDVSQNDGKSDKVYEGTSITGGAFNETDWKHGNNTFKLNDSDKVEVRGNNKNFKGQGTYKSEMY